MAKESGLGMTVAIDDSGGSARTISSQVLAGELVYTDYALGRSSSGELTWSAPGALAGGAVPTWA